MAKGIIKTWLGDRGLGFIKPDDGSEDVRFFADNLRDGSESDIQVGARVEYELRSRSDRPTTHYFKIVGASETPQSVQPKQRAKRETVAKDYPFLNPYNFVRYLPDRPARPDDPPEVQLLGRCPPPPHDRWVGLSGRITCEVKAVTPVFVSDSEDVLPHPKKSEHKQYGFFQWNGDPAIPASSLRGMVRSVFEAATNSCFAALSPLPLSYHLDSRRAPWLVPARVEQDGDTWRLHLLTGTTPLQIENPETKGPEGMQYAAWLTSFWPVKPSKTLQGIEPRLRGGRTLSAKQRETRQQFIERTKDAGSRNPEELGHRVECYALLRHFNHPHPKVVFWDVVRVSKSKSNLPSPEGEDERVVRGWLCVTNQNIESKHSERFFFRDPKNQVGPETIQLEDPVRAAYENLIKDYQERHRKGVEKRRRLGLPEGERIGDEPSYSRFIYARNESRLQNSDLVYAFLEGSVEGPQVKFIVPVSVPRVGYEKAVGSLLFDHVRHCHDYDELCPTCRVFGWVSDKPVQGSKPVAYASRVRFSHAKLIRDAGPEDGITLAILSSPKPTTTLFYLADGQGKPADVTYDTEGAQLRGRKVYRHHGAANQAEYTRATDEKHDGLDDQNRTIIGARKPDSAFEFTIDFENLAPVELGALVWALELEPGMCHRLGFAKPLGFGSVMLTVTALQLMDPGKHYAGLDGGWEDAKSKKGAWITKFKDMLESRHGPAFADLDNVRDLQTLLSKPRSKLPIHYPRTADKPDPEGKNFEWFVENKRGEPGRKDGMKLTLPLATEEEDKGGFPLHPSTPKPQR